MLSFTCPSGARRVFAAAVLCVACLALPAGAHAAAIDLATAKPFVVLGGNSVTNTGPSVLDGDLGVYPGTALVGFGFPAVVNGDTHATDAVAAQAQADLTNAYNVAAGQPVPPGNVLTGTDLGSRTLTPGAYRYSSSAQLTGELTLDAQGDPSAEFVFEIGSTLTTASASSVRLVNGASPCNVYWQVGSSATLGSTTRFQGNVMALSDISVNNGATVLGRLLAGRDITLINNVLDRSDCALGSSTPGEPSPTPGTTAPGTSAPEGSTPAGPGPTTSVGPEPTTPGGPTVAPTSLGEAKLRRLPNQRCADGFRAAVTGRLIRRVVFTLDGRPIASRKASPFSVFVHARVGTHVVGARVTFLDGTRAKRMTVRYRVCAAALLRPRNGPSRFTG
jgi:hypothetical protein